MSDSKKNNIIFLDYDGVINIEEDNFYGYLENPEAIYFINKLCLENDFKIVISSSWKRHPQHKKLLHDAGLDEKVKIVGCTDITHKGREFEIKKYLKEHPDIDKYLIIDDADFSIDIKDHLVQTVFNIGFNKMKYEEALDKIKKM